MPWFLGDIECTCVVQEHEQEVNSMHQQLRQQEEAVRALEDELATSQQEQQQSAEVAAHQAFVQQVVCSFWCPVPHQPKPGANLWVFTVLLLRLMCGHGWLLCSILHICEAPSSTYCNVYELIVVCTCCSIW